MISPVTSGAIFTSTSGWTLPVAETICVMVFTTAFSVVTTTALSPRLLATIATTTRNDEEGDAGENEPERFLALAFGTAEVGTGDGAVSWDMVRIVK